MSAKLGENIAREWVEDVRRSELWGALQLIKSDPVAGSESLRGLAEGGSSLAMVYLGSFYRSGKYGLPLDPELAEYWLRRSAAKGSVEGAYGHAYHLLKTGRASLAFEEFERLGDRGYAPAFHAIGAQLYKGEFVERDLARALQYFLRAESMGHLVATIWASRLLLRGQMGLRGRLRGLTRLARSFGPLAKTIGDYPNSDRLRH